MRGDDDDEEASSGGEREGEEGRELVQAALEIPRAGEGTSLDWEHCQSETASRSSPH